MERRFFEEGGADYANFRPTYPKELAATLASLCEEQKLAIDVGCGTGQLTALLANYFDQMLASDVSADQLANAIQHPSITYYRGPAEQMDADDQSADLITAAQAAHWFHLDDFYKEAKRVLKPGGLLALITYGVLEVEGPAKQRIDQFYWQEIHPFWPSGRENVENGYQNFPFPFKPVSIPKMMIERQWDAEALARYCNTWSAGKRARAAGRSDIIDTMKDDVSALVGEAGRLKIRWPLSIRAGRMQ